MLKHLSLDIPNCKECPYSEIYEESKYTDCNKMELKTVLFSESIPDWCPLPDVEDKEAEKQMDDTLQNLYEDMR